MPRQVTVTITGIAVGSAQVLAYSHVGGRVASAGYIVPLYRMTVSGTDNSNKAVSASFQVIRFGVENRNGQHRVVGLSEAQRHVLRRAAYMRGSWQITGNFLIHDGSDYPLRQAWGAIGCIEVTGVGQWPRFETLVRSLSGTDNLQEITRAGTLIAVIQAAPRPPLVLASVSR